MGYLDVYRSYWGNDDSISQRFGTYSRALAGRDDISLTTTMDNDTAYIQKNAITVTHPKVIQKAYDCDSETAFTISKALTAHESAHAKYTDNKKYQQILGGHQRRAMDQEDMKDFVGALNAIEDLRVNALQANKRPGFSEDYKFYEAQLAEHIKGKLSGPLGLEFGIVKWLLEQNGVTLDKALTPQGYELYQWLKANVDPETVKTLQDTEEIGTELYREVRRIKGKKDNSKAPQRPQDPNGEDEDGEPGDQPSKKSKHKVPKQEKKGDKSDDAGDEGDEGQDGEGQEEEGEGSTSGVSAGDDGNDDGDGTEGDADGDGDSEDGDDEADAEGYAGGGVGATKEQGKQNFDYNISEAPNDSVMDRVFDKKALERIVKAVEADATEDDLDMLYKNYEVVMSAERLGFGGCIEKQSKADFIRTRRMTTIPNHAGVPVYRYKYKGYKGTMPENEYNKLKTTQERQAKVLADTLKRIMDEASEAVTSKHGSLTARKAYRHQFSKNVFHKSTQDTGGYAVCLLLDESGSMGRNENAVHNVAYTLGRAFVLAGIPLEILTFNDSTYTYMATLKEFDSDDLSKVTMYGPTRSNRDGLAVYVASLDLMQRPEENKILVVLSDGSPASSTSCSLAGVGSKHRENTLVNYSGSWDTADDKLDGDGAIDTAKIVRKIRSTGIHVGGIYFGRRAHEQMTIKGMYGNDFANVTDLSRLPHIMAQFFERFTTK